MTDNYSLPIVVASYYNYKAQTSPLPTTETGMVAFVCQFIAGNNNNNGNNNDNNNSPNRLHPTPYTLHPAPCTSSSTTTIQTATSPTSKEIFTPGMLQHLLSK